MFSLNSLSGLLIRSRSSMVAGMMTAVAVFALQYHLLATLPGASNAQCVVGSGMTSENIVFGALTALLSGLIVASLWLASRQRVMKTAATLSLSSIGTFLAILTGVCTLCALPALSFFGLSISLGFTSHHLWLTRITSTALLCVALWYAARQVRRECARCVT